MLQFGRQSIGNCINIIRCFFFYCLSYFCNNYTPFYFNLQDYPPPFSEGVHICTFNLYIIYSYLNTFYQFLILIIYTVEYPPRWAQAYRC
jgi:hypothetical protein